MVILVPVLILLMVKLPLLPVTVPALALILAPLVTVNVTEYVSKLGAHCTVPMVITGLALAVTVKLTGAPGHVPTVGTTVNVATSVLAKPAGVVNAILPVPDAPTPIFVLLLVQAKVAPVLPLKLTVTKLPAQRLGTLGVDMVGAGFTVKITGVLLALIQPVKGSRVSA